MGVTYKLREEVVHFIISQRRSNPLASCRLLAESTSQKFGLRLSKSSVHDVLKESGITTPRGRKPKYKFEIPQEKKKQIQVSFSQVGLIPSPVEPIPEKQANRTSSEYENAGRIFLKAALWDLGIFSEENIKATDWDYYLTYSKGIRVVLEGNKSYFIDLPLPLERCIREATDGLINNVKPFIVQKVSDEGFFKASMNAQEGFKIHSISIVDYEDHILFELSNIMDEERIFMLINRIFVENNERNAMERSKAIFFSQMIENNEIIEDTLNLKGFDSSNKEEYVVTLIVGDSYGNKAMLLEAVEKLNGMYLCDEQNRLVRVKIDERPNRDHGNEKVTV